MGVVYRALSGLCALTRHAGGCWLMNGPVGQWALRKALRKPAPVHGVRFGPGSIVVQGDAASAAALYDMWEKEARRRARESAGGTAPLSSAWEPQ